MEVLDGEVIVALLEQALAGVLASEGDVASKIFTSLKLGENHVVEDVSISKTALPLVRGGKPDHVRDSRPIIPDFASDLQRGRVVGYCLVESHQHPTVAAERAEDL